MTLSDELRAEIEEILRAAVKDNRHAMAFSAMQDGLSTKQIAKEWDKSQSYVAMVVRSVRYLLDGELPARPSMAMTNSFGYRDLLDYRPSEELRSHAIRCLRTLRECNPRVKVEPMGNFAFPDAPGVRGSSLRPTSYCPRCYLVTPCDCD